MIFLHICEKSSNFAPEFASIGFERFLYKFF